MSQRLETISESRLRFFSFLANRSASVRRTVLLCICYLFDLFHFPFKLPKNLGSRRTILRGHRFPYLFICVENAIRVGNRDVAQMRKRINKMVKGIRSGVFNLTGSILNEGIHHFLIRFFSGQEQFFLRTDVSIRINLVSFQDEWNFIPLLIPCVIGCFDNACAEISVIKGHIWVGL